MNLIPQWTQLWKLYSVQIAAILVVLNAAATYWPALQGVVSPGVFATVNSLLGAAVILGRIIQQPSGLPAASGQIVTSEQIDSVITALNAVPGAKPDGSYDDYVDKPIQDVIKAMQAWRNDEA